MRVLREAGGVVLKALPPYRGVVCYSGLPGSGKSYSLVELACHALAAGMKVFTNAGFEIEYQGRKASLYFSLEELLTVPTDSVVLLDEAPVYVNSRKSAEFPRGLLYRMTQVRKDGLRFYYSAIDEMMVDVNLRRVTFWTQRCRRLPLGFFVRSLWPPVDRCTSDDKSMGRKFYRLRQEVADAYNTHGKVWIPPEVLEGLLSDVVKPWVPLTDEVVEVLWAGGRDPVRARELLDDLKSGRLMADLPEKWTPPLLAAAQGPAGPAAAVQSLVQRREPSFNGGWGRCGWCGSEGPVAHVEQHDAWACRACVDSWRKPKSA